MVRWIAIRSSLFGFFGRRLVVFHTQKASHWLQVKKICEIAGSTDDMDLVGIGEDGHSGWKKGFFPYTRIVWKVGYTNFFFKSA